MAQSTVTSEAERLSEGKDLAIAPTASSPYVRGDWGLGTLVMAGESYPENAYDLFDVIIGWVDLFLKTAGRPLAIELHLNYLNTSSVRGMIDIFDALQDSSDQGRDVSVVWLYDAGNPRAVEMGEEFKEDYLFPFEIRSVEAP